MKVLLAGGTGYIGSHVAVELIKRENEVVIVDNLINSSASVVDKIKMITNKKVDFKKLDITHLLELERVFENNSFDAVIHLAALKSVSESINMPLDYYEINVLSTINLLKMCDKYDVSRFIYSSSANVYGSEIIPYSEDDQDLKVTNPYGETKIICEKIVSDWVKSSPGKQVTILRYFNPVGADSSGLIGDNPKGIPSNIMPYITRVAKGDFKEVTIFGNDYETVDGTGVRDYIHVSDLANGHVHALNCIKEGVEIFNLGSGEGISVLQLIKTFEKSTGIKIPYTISNRRSGDVGENYASVDKVNRILNWKVEKTLEDMCRDSWYFIKNQEGI